MRRLAMIASVALLLTGCGDDDDQAEVVDRTRAVPADVRAFVDRIVDPATISAHLEYHVLNKNGGGEHDVEVVSQPPELTITIDGEEVDITDESALAQYGIFSGFMAANPKAAIEATARREDAGDAEHTQRDGDDCIGVPVQGAVTSTWCVGDEGILTSVDTPSVRYELTTLLIDG
jgi:hypothetical protein